MFRTSSLELRMKNFLVSLIMLALSSAGIGCAEKSSTKTEKTVTTPSGKTTITEEKEVKKSGDNPP
jgi:hypothetical protein